MLQVQPLFTHWNLFANEDNWFWTWMVDHMTWPLVSLPEWHHQFGSLCLSAADLTLIIATACCCCCYWQLPPESVSRVCKSLTIVRSRWLMLQVVFILPCIEMAELRIVAQNQNLFVIFAWDSEIKLLISNWGETLRESIWSGNLFSLLSWFSLSEW